jgi:hypothetical protein
MPFRGFAPLRLCVKKEITTSAGPFHPAGAAGRIESFNLRQKRHPGVRMDFLNSL